MVEICYLTEGLLDALLDIAADREPEALSTLLAVRPAGELERPEAGVSAERSEPPATVSPGDLDAEVPVFTDVYLPAASRSVDAVFGMDVTIPHGQAQGRFVSHPLGELSVSTTDDLHEVVVVAVPPWGRDDVAAFDRGGSRLDLRVVAGAPPAAAFEH